MKFSPARDTNTVRLDSRSDPTWIQLLLAVTTILLAVGMTVPTWMPTGNESSMRPGAASANSVDDLFQRPTHPHPLPPTPASSAANPDFVVGDSPVNAVWREGDTIHIALVDKPLNEAAMMLSAALPGWLVSPMDFSSQTRPVTLKWEGHSGLDAWRNLLAASRVSFGARCGRNVCNLWLAAPSPVISPPAGKQVVVDTLAPSLLPSVEVESAVPDQSTKPSEAPVIAETAPNS